MDLWTVIRVVARRWYVSAPLLVLVVLAAVEIGEQVRPDYEAGGSVILLPPAPEYDAEGEPLATTNPFLRSNPTVLANSVMRVLQSPEELRELEAAGLSPNVELSHQRDASIIDVLVTAGSDAVARETVEVVIDRVQEVMDELQADTGAPEREFLGLRVLASPTTATELAGDRMRVILTIIGLGMVVVASAALAWDAVAQRRRRSRPRRAASAKAEAA